MKRVACVLVRCGEVGLLLRRSPNDTHHPGRWNLPGGGARPTETDAAAAARELLEETGIVVDEHRLRPLVMYIEQGEDYRVFQLDVAERPEVRCEPGCVAEWFAGFGPADPIPPAMEAWDASGVCGW